MFVLILFFSNDFCINISFASYVLGFLSPPLDIWVFFLLK